VALLPARPRALIRVVLAVCAGWLVLHELLVTALHGHHAGPLDHRAVHDVLLLAASGATLARGVLVRRERAAWLLLGGGVLAWTFGEIYYTAVLWDDSSPPIPSPADIGYLLFPLLALAGMLLLLRSRAKVSPTLLVDAIACALAVGSLSAAIVLQTVMRHISGDTASIATALAYPITDLVLLAVGMGALAGTGWRADRTWVLVAAGISAFWFADSMYLVQTAAGTYVAGGWFDAGWWIGLLLIASAAWQEPPAERRRPRADSLRLIAAPLVAGAIGVEVLLYGCFGRLNAPAVCLAAASLVFVMIRLTLTFRQNVAMLKKSRDEARTDALTGLGNRRLLARELDEALESGDDHVLALFDLDGFKHYNDTFGHPAGDALLIRLAAKLERYFQARGRVYRMGGDEFCALFTPGVTDVATVLDGAALALTEETEGVWIGCSFGAITLPKEAAAAESALRIADQRMYTQKHAGRRSAARQSKDVLVSALIESNPALAAQLTARGDLAEATARRLGLRPDEIETVRLAAELHDVGRMAVAERHTTASERIIGAAPALAAVARLVRSSSEHWDGSGFPDRLAGEAIPFGARIVAVVAAADALSPAELRAGAGTWFDPAVVDAFCESALAPV
jgi:diguanylate cyclase (GGDEF)-like protein